MNISDYTGFTKSRRANVRLFPGAASRVAASAEDAQRAERVAASGEVARFYAPCGAMNVLQTTVRFRLRSHLWLP
jgi:hypothetical protein